MTHKFTLGLIINPIAGIGGKIGMKGSDDIPDEEDLNRTEIDIQAPRRTQEFLSQLSNSQDDLLFLTPPGIMGGDLLQKFGFPVELLPENQFSDGKQLFHTTAQHTQRAAQLLLDRRVDLLVFVGGDGTARDVCEVIGINLPALGLPAGVKIHSSVFAINPRTCATLVHKFLQGEIPLREAEVMDIDESKFRNNEVVSKLYGYLMTPYAPTLSQPSKMASPHTEHEHENQNRLAEWIIMDWEAAEPETYYLIGPGTTTRAIAENINQPKTLLGVDLYYDKKLIAQDLNEQEILEHIRGHKVKLIVTPIGAQGFVFGRGNLQLSPEVLSTIGMENILIIATKYKVSTLPQRKLRCDSRDRDFDLQFQGLHRILVDFGEFYILEII